MTMSDGDAQAAVMKLAHASWAQKAEIADILREAATKYAENVYTEFSTVRGCTREASYREAREQLETVALGAIETAMDRLGSKIT
jgi:hypothetical protein